MSKKNSKISLLEDFSIGYELNQSLQEARKNNRARTIQLPHSHNS